MAKPNPRAHSLASRLAEARKQLSPPVSATKLGRTVEGREDLPGFKAAHVSAMELGYRYATWPEVEALAKALNVDPYWLANKPRAVIEVPRALPVSPENTGKVPPRPAGLAKEAYPPVAAKASPKPADFAPVSLPSPTLGTEAEYRAKLLAEFNLVMVKLGDTRLTPAEWVSWREYEKKLRVAATGTVYLPS